MAKDCRFRDVLAHGYFGIDDDIVYDVIINKVPALLEALEDVLGDSKE